MDELTKGMVLFEQDPSLDAQIKIMYFEWTRAYPNIDVKRELASAHMWLRANQTRKKKNIIRFLDNWFRNEDKRRAERRTIERRGSGKYVEHRPSEDEVMTAEDWSKIKDHLKERKAAP